MMHPLYALLTGSFLFVAVFMATDPITAPKKPLAQWIYGLVVGCCAMLIRAFSAFSEGTSFAILFGNTFAALFDELAARLTPREKKEASA
jgi:Na+-transporting NADH:ubiquinone oxidoreductase subunit B